MKYNSIGELIGNTPLVLLEKFSKKNNLDLNIYAKLEKYNLAGSSKDRACKMMIDEAFKSGKLKEGSTIIEATSGNTGIALSALANLYNLNCIIVMPENMTKERIMIMEAYGSKVFLTEASLGMKGSIEKAKSLNAEIPNSLILGQFDNEDCIKAHYETTAREIYEDLPDIDVFICGIGSGATISGCGKYFKEVNPNIKIIGVEPSSSPLISKGIASSHKIQGIGANFIPSNYKSEYVDEIVTVSDEEAYEETRNIARIESLFVGISSGAVIACLKKVASSYQGKNVCILLADSLDRYLSVARLLDRND